MQPLGTRVLALVADHAPQVAPPPASAPPEPSAVRATTAEQRSQARAAGLVGRTIADRYRIDSLLAMGGMGAVYVGRHLLLKKRVAIKILHPDTEGLPGLVTRFEREAIAGAHVVHPHVAAATDFGQLPDGSYFLVLEYVAGRTLHDLLGEGAVPPARAVHLVRQLASALGAAHAMGIVHRDLKPANVMLVEGKDDFVKLIDFGFARVPVDEIAPPRSTRLTFDGAETIANVTAVGVVFGTIEYMAPEAALGMSAVGPPADLYALGVILYELLAGRHPFEETEPAALFSQHRFTPPPPLAAGLPGAQVAPALEAIVMRLLEKAPGERFATSGDLIAALDALGPGAGAPPAPAVVSRPGGRSLVPVLLTLGALVLGLAAVGHYRNGNGAGGHPVPAAAPSPPDP